MANQHEFLSLKPHIWQDLYHLFRNRNIEETKEETCKSISSLLQKFKFDKDLANSIAPDLFKLLTQTEKFILEQVQKEEDLKSLEEKVNTEQVIISLDVNPCVASRVKFSKTPSQQEVLENIKQDIYINNTYDRLRFSSKDISLLSNYITDLVNSDKNLKKLIVNYTTLVNQAVDGISLTPQQYKSSLSNLANKMRRRENFRIALLLTSFVAYARYNAHPSNWIHYKKDIIFHLAGLTRLSTMEKNSLTQYIHFNYKLDMQVVGSTNPIPCYKIAWLADQPTPGMNWSDNPLVDVGPFAPTTLFNTVLYLVSSDDEKLEEKK